MPPHILLQFAEVFFVAPDTGELFARLIQCEAGGYHAARGRCLLYFELLHLLIGIYLPIFNFFLFSWGFRYSAFFTMQPFLKKQIAYFRIG